MKKLMISIIACAAISAPALVSAGGPTAQVRIFCNQKDLTAKNILESQSSDITIVLGSTESPTAGTSYEEAFGHFRNGLSESQLRSVKNACPDLDEVKLQNTVKAWGDKLVYYKSDGLLYVINDDLKPTRQDRQAFRTHGNKSVVWVNEKELTYVYAQRSWTSRALISLAQAVGILR